MRTDAHSAPRLKPLISKREMLVLKLVAKGCTNKDISERLFISVETVKKHLKNCYKKLGVCNKIQALRKAGLLK